MTDHRSIVRTSLLGFCLLLGLPGCESTQFGPTREVRGDLELLARRQPADVAVAPVRDQTGKDSVPRNLMRAAFEEALVDRMYSPLAAKYVDQNWMEASFRGTPLPDALLLVVIENYDPSRLYSSGQVEIGGEVVLFEGADTTGAVLWSTTLREEVDLSEGRRGPPTPSATLIPEAIRRFAALAMSRLPERDPVAAQEPPSGAE